MMWKKLFQFLKNPWRPWTRELSNRHIFRGYFDRIIYQDGFLEIGGWVLNPQGPFDQLVLYVNGTQQALGTIVQRPDVAQGLPWIPRSIESGFSFRTRLKPGDVQGGLDIRVDCLVHDEVVDRMETAFFTDLYETFPVPPLPLIKRVDGSESGDFYLLKGAQNFREFWRLIEKHASQSSLVSLLDWGCGSGRLTGFFLKYTPIADVHGCDIDAQAIQWAEENFPQGTFSTIPLLPPTRYPDHQFDVIVSFSVLTHLDRETQNAWLAEMARILKPGGVFIATVHGIKAARVILSADAVEELKRDGIYDAMRDTSLEGIAPEDYYRASFQTQDYILRNWPRYFDIVEHIEQGASHYHDIVVMRKRPS